MAMHEVRLQADDETVVEMEMTDAELAFLTRLATALNANREAYAPIMLIDGKEPCPRCTCGALVYSGCFCNVSVRDFLRSGPGRRI